MPAPVRKYDALGFPVPTTFDDLALPDRDAIAGSAGSAGGDGKPKQRRASRRKRVALGLVLVCIVAVAAVPWLTDFGQGLLGEWLAQRAREKFVAGDMSGTVADCTRAFSLLGEELNDQRQIELLSMRACAKLEINDLRGSLADFDRVLASPKAAGDVRAVCYFRRAWVNCRLENHEAAIADASAAIDLDGRGNPVLLNQRAYIRAIANLNQQELEAGLSDVEQALAIAGDNAAFIDTRGYLLHLLGRNDQALREMNRAIQVTSQMKRSVYRADEAAKLIEDLAVMYHHRGLIHEALGIKDKSAEDFALAKQYGYNPEAGVL